MEDISDISEEDTFEEDISEEDISLKCINVEDISLKYIYVEDISYSFHIHIQIIQADFPNRLPRQTNQTDILKDLTHANQTLPNQILPKQTL